MCSLYYHTHVYTHKSKTCEEVQKSLFKKERYSWIYSVNTRPARQGYTVRSCLKERYWAWKDGSPVKVLVVDPDNQSSIPETHMTEGEKRLQGVL